MKNLLNNSQTILSSLKSLFLRWLGIVFLISMSLACEDFVEIDPPRTELVSEDVFSSDETVISAIHGVYGLMSDGSNFFTGSIEVFTGTAVDELDNFSSDIDDVQFASNNLSVNNSLLFTNFWRLPYEVINNANLIIEGLRNNDLVTLPIRDQVLGEALFIRAFTHFYLVNLFGNVPYINSTNVAANASVSREASETVYDKILEDLQEAQSLMEEGYSFVPGEERLRPNRATAVALLARVYLYIENWAEAEIQATSVIEQNELYVLVDSLDEVFLATSQEAIWQLRDRDDGLVNQGLSFNLVFPPGNFQSNIFTTDFMNSIEAEDNRLDRWIGEANFGTVYYYPNKYTGTFFELPDQLEYLVVFRLAEQYLIRAEARANQSNVSGAIEDLDVIRRRAGLPLIADTNPGISLPDLLLVIEQERRIEFFAEWGHRWLDLKRTGRANEVLGPLKEDWQPTDALFPIPEREILDNPNLLPQNQGYY